MGNNNSQCFNQQELMTLTQNERNNLTFLQNRFNIAAKLLGPNLPNLTTLDNLANGNRNRTENIKGKCAFPYLSCRKLLEC